MRSGQRFHHHRQGAMVAPGATGLLFTVDPNQTGKAIRELRLYLDRFRGLVSTEPAPDAGVEDDDDGTPNQGGGKAPVPEAIASTSSLLAAELAEFRKTDQMDGAAQPFKKRPEKREVAFSILETNCKGYVFVNIPRALEQDAPATGAGKRPREEGSTDAPESTDTPDKSKVFSEASPSIATLSATVDSDASAQTAQSASTNERAPRSFFVNEKVPEVVEAIFSELALHPDRPITRFSYRMYPCAVSCFPVSASMCAAVKELCSRIPPIPGRSALKLGLHFTVKNNTNVEKEKLKLRTVLEGCLPQNKFLVLPCGRKGIALDGVLHVVVLHSTCCVGYAPMFSARREYNLHDFGKPLTESDA